MSGMRWLAVALVVAAAGCSGDDYGPGPGPGPVPYDPETAPQVAVDRFSADAGTLFVRTGENGLPAANTPIDFDLPPFRVQAFGPDGEVVTYYNFDATPETPANLYVFFRAATDEVVAGQLPVIDQLPGDAGYSDFRRVVRVIVPADYVANTVASLPAIQTAAFPLEPTEQVINYPVVPAGSTADLRVNGNTQLLRGWYRNQVFFFFAFTERLLNLPVGEGFQPRPLFVSFNINPGEEGGGFESGFRAELGSLQTHNVLAFLPDQADYAPFWQLIAYDRADFDDVIDLATAQEARILTALQLVNSPVVGIEE
jgi:hypothetical protein